MTFQFYTLEPMPDPLEFLTSAQRARLKEIDKGLHALGVRVLGLRDVDGLGLILHWMGKGLDYEIDGMGEDAVADEMLSDLPADPGLWVWEGNLIGTTYNSPETGYDYDTEFTGEWRVLSEEERRLLEENPHDVTVLWEDWNELMQEQWKLEREAHTLAREHA